MIITLINKIINTFKEKSSLSLKIQKNIIYSFLIKGGTIIINLTMVPITLNYIDVKQYGIWLVISSLASWMSFFDIGLGHGLRNALIKSLFEENVIQSRVYISTTFVVLSVISLTLFLFIFFLIERINWWNILNIDNGLGFDLNTILIIVLGSFCLQLVFQVQNIVLSAHHESAKINFIGFVGQLLSLIGVIILRKFYEPQLINLVFILSVVPLFVNILSLFYIFKVKYPHLVPSIKLFRYFAIKDLYKTSFLFFIIQFCAIILFQSNNLIINEYVNPESVAEYNIAQKLFSIVVMVFIIIITPYWSGYAESYARKDFDWIKNSLNRIRLYSLVLVIISILILYLSEMIVKIWLDDVIRIDFSLKFSIFVYNILFIWQTIHVYFLNGIGKIKFQALLVTFCTILNIIISLNFVKVYGTEGVVYSNIIIFFIMGFLFYYQTELILKDKARGIWS